MNDNKYKAIELSDEELAKVAGGLLTDENPHEKCGFPEPDCVDKNNPSVKCTHQRYLRTMNQCADCMHISG